jgi:hypothetical protein
MKLYVSIPALVAAGLLSACSSNSTTPVSQIDGAIGFIEALDEAEFSEVDVDNLPDNATMNGYIAAATTNSYRQEAMVAEPASQTVYLGDATADFNFAANSLSGSATNFNEYEVTEGEAGLTTEQGRALDGSLAIIGDIDGTDFYYSANGQLTSEVDELGTVTANVFLGGDGGIFLADDKLTAVGGGGGSVDLISSETGYLDNFELDNVIGLQE